jgi:hypothetical protein
MPAAQKITLQQREALKYYLERLSGIRIEHTYNGEELSSFLKKCHKINISESTLKRIFGLVKSTESASVYTLNLLVSVLGFSSWKSFSDEIKSIDIQTLNMLLIRRMSGQKDPDINSKIELKQLNLDQWTTAYQLHLLIDSSIRLKEEAFLNQLLEFPLDDIDISVEDKLYFALQPIAIHAEMQNAFIIKWVKKHISNARILQKYVLQGNVFDTKLLDFYGEWLSDTPDNYPDDMPIFKSVLLCQRAYLNKDPEQAKLYLKNSISWQKQHPDKTHPILRGRIAAWDHILFGEMNLLVEYYEQETDIIAKIELLEFAARLIWQHTDENQQLPFLNELDLNQLPVFTNFYQKGRSDVMKLVKAINHFNADKIVNAKKLLTGINPVNFHFSDRIWLEEKYLEILNA